MKISMFGSGYVGLVSAACFADAGHSVLCVDVDADRVAQLKRGEVPIYEPGLAAMLKRNAKQGRLSFTTDGAAAVRFGQLLFVAVGTPAASDGSAYLGQVMEVARLIGEHIDGSKLIINKSTVPVGTAEQVAVIIAAGIAARGVQHDFEVCSNPEFLKEGAAIEDFTKAARIVIGADSSRATALLRECYAPYNRNHDKIICMDVRAAELTKYAANAMLATKISFMNEMAAVAQRLGVDVEQVRQGIGSDPRIGYDFIYPGCGYGGTCLPKDVAALTRSAAAAGYPMKLLSAVSEVNRQQKAWLFDTLQQAMGGQLAGKQIALWGLSFKPNTDDMREAPSRVLMESLWSAGASVRAYDPKAAAQAARLYGERDDLLLCSSREQAVTDADALVICTEWKQFRAVDFSWLKATLKQALVVDGRNLYQPAEMRAHGLRYHAVGRGDAVPLQASEPADTGTA